LTAEIYKIRVIDHHAHPSVQLMRMKKMPDGTSCVLGA